MDRTPPKFRLHSAECFYEAIKTFRENGWWKQGEQKLMAERLGCAPTHLSHILTGKRGAGSAMQEKIAHDLGLRVEDMLKIGRDILEGRGFFPLTGKIEHLKPHSKDQAHEIVSLTNKQFGLEDNLHGYQPAGWKDFLEGKKTPKEFYDGYSDELRRLRDIILVKSGAKIESISPTPIESKEIAPGTGEEGI